MNDGRRSGVQKIEPLQDLLAPGLEYPGVDPLESFEVGLECARGHEFCYEYDVLFANTRGFADFPGVIESDNVRMLHTFQHFCFLTKPFPLFPAQFFLLKKNHIFFSIC